MGAGSPIDDERTHRAIERIEKLILSPFSSYLMDAILAAPSPELALANLERWVSATSNPATLAAFLGSAGDRGRLVISLLGSSHQLADVLVQNPELGSLLLDQTDDEAPTKQEIFDEGSRLLQVAQNYSFKLDRLRYLKQKWSLRIAFADLGKLWEESKVWLAISNLADAILALAREAVWAEISPELPCPVEIVAFGKLGGCELNFSSDVDLAFLLPDGSDGLTENLGVKFVEKFSRALSDRMGRGALYRVDLRLRPYGRFGPAINTLSTVVTYYQQYAEPWEHLALIRSRVVCGTRTSEDRWESLRTSTCFKPHRGSWAIDAILSDRQRTEQSAESGDLKRSKGGIRDVESLAQVLQLVNGYETPTLQGRSTIQALASLGQSGLVDRLDCAAAIEGYTFLRQLEHRCQIVGNLQTHSVPSDQLSKGFLARTMGFEGPEALDSELERVMRSNSEIYEKYVSGPYGGKSTVDARAQVFGQVRHPETLALWLDSLPASEKFYEGLNENSDALNLAIKIVEWAPRLASRLRGDADLSERVLSGEWEALSVDVPSDIQRLARWISERRSLICSRWIAEPTFDFSVEFGQTAELAIRALVASEIPLFAIALGSFASNTMSLESDADLLLITRDSRSHPSAELAAQELLAQVQRLRNLGAEMEVDLRLRPEGRKGLLVPTLEGFEKYSNESMEAWERFALGNFRLIIGDPSLLPVIHHAAYPGPLCTDDLESLLAMKQRMEAERVLPQHREKHVKMGRGGLDDIDWLIQLSIMDLVPSEPIGNSIEERIRFLVDHQKLTLIERDELMEAHRHFAKLRLWIALMGFESDLVPDNPDKLERLALAAGFTTGAELAIRDRESRQAVRSIYEQVMERLSK